MIALVRPDTRYAPEPFRPHRWFKNPHLQTCYGEVTPRRLGPMHDAWRRVAREHVFELSDGDRLQAFVHLHPDDPEPVRPIVLHLHGLEGDAQAHYQLGASAKAYAAGFHSVRLNFRNCGDTEHMARSLYTGRHTRDVLEVLATMRGDWGFKTLYATGVSLGANLLLRLLADAGNEPPAGLSGVATISPPIEMAAAGIALRKGLNRGYEAYFLRSLKRKMKRKMKLSPGGEALAPVVEQLKRVRTLSAFDELVTAPLAGYQDTADYYRQASSSEELHRIHVPTLIIHAQDDPFIPYGMFSRRQAAISANPFLSALFPERGGHVGFLMDFHRHHRQPWMDERWAENEAIAYLASLK